MNEFGMPLRKNWRNSKLLLKHGHAMRSTTVILTTMVLMQSLWPYHLKNLKDYLCEIAKEACDILQITHEWNLIIKHSKLQMLTSQFEEIKMLKVENFSNFYVKLKDIMNFRFNLDEMIEYSKVVRKIMRSLPERFWPKVTTI